MERLSKFYQLLAVRSSIFNEIDLGPITGTYPSIAFECLGLCNHSTYFRHLYGLFFCLNPESYTSVTVLVAT